MKSGLHLLRPARRASPPAPGLASPTGSEAAGSLPQTDLSGGWLLLLSALLVGGLFLLQGRIGLDLTDEGFLWYGAVRTAHGGVPLRDFYAYDPGRYLWAAAWAQLLGDGILALRLSTAIFAAFGLFLGLLAVRRSVASRGLLLAVAVVLALWMLPRHKLFESSLAMAGVYVALRVLEKPSVKSWVAAGVATGLAAIFGKNHGLYWSLSFLALLFFLHLRIERGRYGRDLLAWLSGVAAGLLPFLLMAVAVPGFFRSELDSLLFFILQGRTNSPLPVPWPWRPTYSGVGAWVGATQLALGLSFLLLPCFYALAAVLAWRTGRAQFERRLLLAASSVGVFYMHHAFSRADAAHLGQSIHPALLGLVALPLAWEGGRRRLAAGFIAALVAFVTLFAAVPQSYLVRRLVEERQGIRYVSCDIAGDQLLLRGDLADSLQRIRAAVGERLTPAEPLLILPHFPGLYPFLGRAAPVWDIYMIWPALQGSDERRIEEIERHGVRWALIGGYGEQPWLGLRATHPVLVGYLDERFKTVATATLAPHWVFLQKRREAKSPRGR
jgi:hypothetical protein